MSDIYWLKFGPNDPRNFTGLAPTFVVFQNENGTTQAPPGITERITGTGLYQFTHSSSLSIAFIVDGGATLATVNRYISGSLDPAQAIDVRLTTQTGTTLAAIGSTLVGTGTTLSAIGNTVLAIGTTLSFVNTTIGTTASSFGNVSVDPTTVIGYLKRIQENLEGDAVYTKASGVWTILDRTSGVTLAAKTLTNTATSATKS